MKNLITIVVVVVVALVAFNYFQTGEFKLMPGSSMSPEEEELNRLKGEFRRAAQAYRQAGRSAGVSGLDTTSDAAAAHQTVEGVERDVKALRKRTDDPEVRAALRHMYERFQRFIHRRVAEHRDTRFKGMRPDAVVTAWAIIGLGNVANISRELGLLTDRQRRRLIADAGRLLLEGETR